MDMDEPFGPPPSSGHHLPAPLAAVTSIRALKEGDLSSAPAASPAAACDVPRHGLHSGDPVLSVPVPPNLGSNAKTPILTLVNSEAIRVGLRHRFL
jgi:hypothetical protein